MFIVFLKLNDDRSRLGEHMEGHKVWLQRGFDDGVFLLAGSLSPHAGGRAVGSQPNSRGPAGPSGTGSFCG